MLACCPPRIFAIFWNPVNPLFFGWSRHCSTRACASSYISNASASLNGISASRSCMYIHVARLWSSPSLSRSRCRPLRGFYGIPLALWPLNMSPAPATREKLALAETKRGPVPLACEQCQAAPQQLAGEGHQGPAHVVQWSRLREPHSNGNATSDLPRPSRSSFWTPCSTPSTIVARGRVKPLEWHSLRWMGPSTALQPATDRPTSSRLEIHCTKHCIYCVGSVMQHHLGSGFETGFEETNDCRALPTYCSIITTREQSQPPECTVVGTSRLILDSKEFQKRTDFLLTFLQN